MAEDQTDPPKKWWTTPYLRALHDFEWLASPNIEGAFFRNLDTVAGFVEQRQKLIRQMQITAALSFIGASLVVAGGLPKDGQISFFGVEGPSNLISLQLLAALVAGVFSAYMQQLTSVALLSDMINKVLTPIIPHGPEFVVARYDGSYLWANLLRQRTVGYQSPKGHRVLSAGMVTASLLWLLLLMVVVGTAMWIAVSSAFVDSGVRSFGFLISAVASLTVFMTILIFFFGLFVPLPYPMSKDMAEQLEREKAEKQRAATAAESGHTGSTTLGEVLLRSQPAPSPEKRG